METKKYQNNEITVTWEPSKCIHSAECFKGLPRVFNPRLKPWINLEGSETDRIIKQIDKCPSGAISYVHNVETTNEKLKEQDEVLKVKVMPGGPLILQGNFILEHLNEAQVSKDKITALCRCGQSLNKPFCDGSHRKIEFDK
jgi:uncharacterized Fe-S cluster protein YjdI